MQHLLSLGIPGVAESLWRQLEGRFFYLACNKYGSNVVEKFFQDSVEPYSTYITLELLHNPNVPMLLVDPYGNYVIKSALTSVRVSELKHFGFCNIHVCGLIFHNGSLPFF